MPGLVLLLLGALAQQPRDAVSIRGVVIQPGSLAPVAKATVQLIRDNRSEPLLATTGTDGRFEFQNVPPGTYSLTASRNGFLPTAFGQRGPSGTSRKLTITSGGNLDDIRLLMTATGAISGRVSDNSGEPLANIPVQALKYAYADGKRTLTPVKSAPTNDFGEFRLFWLPPGQYYISAQPQDGRSGSVFVVRNGTITTSMDHNGMVITGDSITERINGPKPGVAYVPVYYPGTADPQSASRVDVRPNADLRGIDFILSPVTTRKVQGTVFNSVTGQPADVANVQLVPRSDIGSPFTGSMNSGKFEIDGVLPGSYFLVATARTGPRDDVRIFGGRTTVDVAYADLENINVTLYPTVTIRGRLTVEGRPEGLPANERPVIFLQAGHQWTFPSLGQTFASFTTGVEFEFDTVEGDYRMWWDRLPTGMYIRSAMFGPIDALTAPIHIEPRTNDTFQIVLSANAGALEGVVRDSLRNVVAGARVALVPDATHRQLAHLYQSTTTEDTGRFRLQGIPPGDYSLFAWEDIEEGQWLDPEFLKRQESAGRPVRIIENSRETVETVAIPYAW